MHLAAPLTPDEFWAVMAATDQRARDHAATLPLFGIVGWDGPRMTGDWFWRDDTLVTAGLAHGRPDASTPGIQVLTTTEPPHTLVGDGARAADPVDIDVAGRPVRFSVFRNGDSTWATARLDGYALVVEARATVPAGLALTPVTDLEPYLDGRRAYLRERRGEA